MTSTASTVVDWLNWPTSRVIVVRGNHRYGAKLNRHPSAGLSAPAPPAWATNTEPGVAEAISLGPAAVALLVPTFGSDSPNRRPAAHPSSAWAVHGASPVTRATSPAHAHPGIRRHRNAPNRPSTPGPVAVM